MKATARDYVLLVFAVVCACVALSRILPGYLWIIPTAIALNGGLCVAHGVAIIRRLRLAMGIFFCLLGGFQLGIVTMIIISVEST
jgi:hypothetical protein